MKNISVSLIFSFLLFSYNTFSEWIELGHTKQSTYYFHSERVFVNEIGYVNYWELTDYAEEGGYGYLSDLSRVMVDCDLMRYKNLQIVKYKDKMGTGKIMGEESVGNKWVYPLPGSIKETAISSICMLMKK